jgi:hypothetical protein
MSDVATTPTRFRSPPYPSMPLQRALERVEQLYRQERDHAVPLTSAARAWGMSPTSSGPIAIAGALRQYGLLEYDGQNEAKKIRLTHDALRITLDRVPTSPSRIEALRRAFLNPKIFSELWDRWPGDLPSDQTMFNYLFLERRLSNQAPYSEQAATELLANYRASLPFAMESEAPSVSVPTGQDGETGNMETEAQRMAMAPPAKALQPEPVAASSAYSGTEGDLSVLLKGGRIQINANVDLAGLARLKEVLGKYEEILELLYPDETQH